MFLESVNRIKFESSYQAFPFSSRLMIYTLAFNLRAVRLLLACTVLVSFVVRHKNGCSHYIPLYRITWKYVNNSVHNSDPENLYNVLKCVVQKCI